MKRLASFLMIGVLTTSFTWSQGSVPDTKENSKTEMVMETNSAKMEKTDLKFSNQNEFLFVKQDYSDANVVVKTEAAETIVPTQRIQKFSTKIPAKRKDVNNRSPKDGLSWQNQS